MLGISTWRIGFLTGSVRCSAVELSPPSIRTFCLSRPSFGGGRRWTEEELRVLLDARRAEKTADEMCELLPDRSKDAIQGKIHGLVKLGIVDTYFQARKWTTEENAQFKAAIDRGVTQSALRSLFPDRSSTALETRYRRMGAKPMTATCNERRHPERFTPEEDRILLKLRDEEKKGWPEISHLMPGRSAGSLWSRYNRLVPPSDRVRVIPAYGMVLSVDEAVLFEQLAAQDLPATVIADQLNRPIGAVRHKLKRLRLAELNWQGRNPEKLWTKETTKALETMYISGLLVEDIAQKLGRSVTSVKRKIDRLVIQDPSLR